MLSTEADRFPGFTYDSQKKVWTKQMPNVAFANLEIQGDYKAVISPREFEEDQFYLRDLLVTDTFALQRRVTPYPGTPDIPTKTHIELIGEIPPQLSFSEMFYRTFDSKDNNVFPLQVKSPGNFFISYSPNGQIVNLMIELGFSRTIAYNFLSHRLRNDNGTEQSQHIDPIKRMASVMGKNIIVSINAHSVPVKWEVSDLETSKVFNSFEASNNIDLNKFGRNLIDDGPWWITDVMNFPISQPPAAALQR